MCVEGDQQFYSVNYSVKIQCENYSVELEFRFIIFKEEPLLQDGGYISTA